ncbi:preprotein translocase subunit SecG [Patescibacteria group bacterium]|nr:preprotein translocase subunit SecG [Patescibacteria group bacterium]MBU4082465.1 preprotein translocase subunit SecG [Patescibacteria group bacterium]MCG2809230.1 preprotein translocase subunit SecG [Candidatus Portnoybacteria bacterium]
MEFTLSIIQIVIALSLITTILLQQRGAGGAGIFGGSGGGGGYYAKRGFEKVLFTASIILSCLFIVTAFVNLLI